MAYISQIKTPDNTVHKVLPKFYAVCSTAANTAAKTVTIDNFTLQQGVTVIIKFTYTNSVSSPTLNVSGTGAKNICQYGTTKASVTAQTTGWYPGSVVMLTYDGTSWVMNKGFNSDNDTTYSPIKLGFGYGVCNTDSSTSVKIVSITNHIRYEYGIVVIKFNYDVGAGASLYINTNAAKDIYYHGTPLANGIIRASDTATFIFHDDKYHLLAVDKAVKYSTYIDSTEPTDAALDDVWFVVQDDNCTVTYTLSGITSSNTNVSITRGSSYTTTLSVTNQTTRPFVIVTMGSANITSTAYNSSTYQITIPEIKGNITIEASAISELTMEDE